jgi:hypothetical protein
MTLRYAVCGNMRVQVFTKDVITVEHCKLVLGSLLIYSEGDFWPVVFDTSSEVG